MPISPLPSISPLATLSALILAMTLATSVAGKPVLDNVVTKPIWSSVKSAVDVDVPCGLTVVERSCSVDSAEVRPRLACASDAVDRGGARVTAGTLPAANSSLGDADEVTLMCVTGEVGGRGA
jgi:hypothetical protein